MSTGANTRSGTLPAALGAGVPVVAIRGAETDPKLFRDGENLVFAKQVSAPGFAEVALRLLRDPELSARVAEGGHRLYCENMTWAHTADQLLADRAS